MARTGFHSRFTIGDNGMTPFGRAALTLLLMAFAIPVAIVGASYGVNAVGAVLDPSDELYRLTRRPPAGSSIVRGTATVATDMPARAFCHVTHEYYRSGKNGGWRTDWHGNVWSGGAVLFEGRRFELNVVGYDSAFSPARTRVVPDGYAVWAPRFDSLPQGGRVTEQCLSPGERVFVEGCRQSDRAWVLGRCAHYGLTITQGDNGSGQARIDGRAGQLAVWFSAGAFALLMVFGYAWFIVRARPLSAALDRREGHRPKKLSSVLIGAVFGVPICFLATQLVVSSAEPGSSAWSYFQIGYTFGASGVAVAILLAVLVYRRRQSLRRALQPVLDAPTVALSKAFAGVVELAVTVPESVATVAGPVSRIPHAWMRFQVQEIRQVGKNRLAYPVFTSVTSPELPICDASGTGALDTAHADFDLRADVLVVKPGKHEEVLQAITALTRFRFERSANHVFWVIEESYVDRGENLYVLGECRRIEDPSAEGTYRMAGTLPVVGGRSESPLIVHAGTERTLLASLRRERTLLDLMFVTIVGLAGGLAAVLIAIAAR